MSDELRDALRAAVDDRGGSQPDLVDLWRAGRRRRSAPRALGAAAAVVVVLAVCAATWAVTSDDGEQVRTTAVPTTMDTGSCWPAPRAAEEALPPATIDRFVHGGAAGVGAPVVVARAEVVSMRWAGPAEFGSEAIAWRHVVQLRVTDPVLGDEIAGASMDLIDAGPVPPRAAPPKASIEAETKEVQRRIDDLQAGVDDAYRPLAELDQQIGQTVPTDPRYEALVRSRASLKERIDASAPVQALDAANNRLQQLRLAEQAGVSAEPPEQVDGPPCHQLAVGDDVIVALVQATDHTPGVYTLASPSSFLLVDADGRFSPALDADRRSVAGPADSDLLRLARESTPDEVMALLHEAAGD